MYWGVTLKKKNKRTNISNSIFSNIGPYHAYHDSIIEDHDQYTSFPRPPILPVWRHIKNSSESKSNGFYLLFNPPSIKCSHSLSLSSLWIFTLYFTLWSRFNKPSPILCTTVCIHLQPTASKENDLCNEMLWMVF